MSGKKVGSVLKLFISKVGTSQRFDEASITLDKYGVHGDKFYNKDAQRSVLLSSYASYGLVRTYGIEMPLGYLGENILIDYNPYNLEIGTQLKIGNTVLEISQNCTICNHLAILDVKIPTLLKNDRGIFTKVIQEGEIKIDDTVYIL